MEDLIRNSLTETQDVLKEFLQNEQSVEKILSAARIMAESLNSGGKVISCGNGGSLCDATHFAEELTGRFRRDRRSLPGIAINDPAVITCTANDFSFDEVFSRYIEGVGCEGDVLLAISTSGNSENVIRAANAAHEKGMKVVALTSMGENRLVPIADVAIQAPRTQFSDRIQEIHIKVIHIMIEAIEKLTHVS